MRLLMTLAVALLSASRLLAQRSDALVGSWQGPVTIGNTTLRLGLIVERGGDGALTATFVSIDQGGVRLPATTAVQGDSVTVTVPAAMIRYVAALTVARDSLAGTFNQGPTNVPLRMARVTTLGSDNHYVMASPPTFPTRLASDADIRALLVKRIDQQRRSHAIVVGVIDPGGRRVVAYGHMAKDDPRDVDANTMFEIGSVTKVFTSLILADMARKGEVGLDDPVAKYLPSNVKIPTKDGRQITLHDLATHTSGLPRLPTNMTFADSANPYADYSEDKLYAYLGTATLATVPGSKYEYSNLGAGLLGLAVARRAGKSYDALVHERVLTPLHLASTRIGVTPDVRARVATGYVTPDRAAKYWDLNALAGAGALLSTTNDLLDFVAANLGETKSTLSQAMADMRDPRIRRPIGVASAEVGLAWHFGKNEGHETVMHDGGTGGFRSFVAFDPARHVGIVVLSNSAAPEGVTDIGTYILNGGGPLYETPAKP